MSKYHVPINSFYLTIDKIRYKNDKYMKCIVSYYYKSSGVKFAQEKNVNIQAGTMQHWELWNE